MADYYHDLVRLLSENGYRVQASGPRRSRNLVESRTGVRVTVDRKLTSRFAANAILKEAGLPKAF